MQISPMVQKLYKKVTEFFNSDKNGGLTFLFLAPFAWNFLEHIDEILPIKILGETPNLFTSDNSQIISPDYCFLSQINSRGSIFSIPKGLRIGKDRSTGDKDHFNRYKQKTTVVNHVVWKRLKKVESGMSFSKVSHLKYISKRLQKICRSYLNNIL